ncbi:tripartite tricarboxylate transporter TctB family protein [Ensifer sp. 4252]|uniref:tripartite tricarboxylate transporter TctB family protein n=1 Tax=Ensifer sp. 4252 TaxID=3373915 RepID=UPI003D1F1EC6
MRIRGINQTEWFAGGLVSAVGLFSLWEAFRYPMGTLHRMGPGFYPAVIALAIFCFGLGIIFFEGRLKGALPPDTPHVRGIVTVLPAIAVFAALIENAGMMPAVFASVMVSTRAEPELSVRNAMLLAIALSVFATLVFVYGLSVPVQAIGRS